MGKIFPSFCSCCASLMSFDFLPHPLRILDKEMLLLTLTSFAKRSFGGEGSFFPRREEGRFPGFRFRGARKSPVSFTAKTPPDSRLC